MTGMISYNESESLGALLTITASILCHWGFPSPKWIVGIQKVLKVISVHTFLNKIITFQTNNPQYQVCFPFFVIYAVRGESLGRSTVL